MNWFNNAPIRVKLISIMMLTAMLALFLATTAVTINEYITKKNDTQKQLALIADIIASNSAASLTFNDTQTAQDILNGLGMQPSLVSASLFDKSGNIFAAYKSTSSLVSPWTGETVIALISANHNSDATNGWLESLFTKIVAGYKSIISPDMAQPSPQAYQQYINYDDHGLLHLLKPILLDGELQGILHLTDDQSGLRALLNRFYLIISLIFVFSGASILYISTKLQRFFLAPLLELMDAMRTVTFEKNI